MSDTGLINRDEEHLRLLAIGHYVFGGFIACLSCLGILYVFFGLLLTGVAVSAHKPDAVPPAVAGLVLAVVGGVMTVIGVTIGLLLVLVGRSLAQRRRYVFCMVMAAIICLSIPFGTLLGVFTIIVLARPSVQARFSLSVPPG